MKIKKVDEMNQDGFNKRVSLLLMDNWEVLYVDGKLITKDYQIEALELLKYAENYNFTYSDVYCDYLDDDDQEIFQLRNFPENIEDLPMYDIWLKKNHPDRYEAKKFKF